ncbi:ArsR/SmtB family transcription factor [Desulfovibrio psychrotolerans]|nr:metalloregulator ArsR/SmtB family transcription factor [Desulfovibrio psychrotolerans]
MSDFPDSTGSASSVNSVDSPGKAGARRRGTAAAAGVPDASPVCQTLCEHVEAIEHVRRAMPHDGDVTALAELFKALGDGTRVRMLLALAAHELCVCDLTSIIGMTQSAVSHQLRYLRAVKLVRYRREGKNVFYSLDDEHVTSLLGQALEHIRENR